MVFQPESFLLESTLTDQRPHLTALIPFLQKIINTDILLLNEIKDTA